MPMKKYRFTFIFLFVCIVLSHAYAQKYSLTIAIEGAKQARGKMQIGLFDKEDDFLVKGAEFKVLTVAVDSLSTQARFNDLPLGKYAISLYHDLDSSGEINRNFIGIPVEPYGISNDAWHLLSAPRWEEASFVVDTDKFIVIHLKH